MDAAMPNENAQTTTIVGIDEAGYGPLLGPLVVSAVAFEVPVAVMQALKDPAAGPNLWKLLKRSLKAKAVAKDPRLAVADSKKLYGGISAAKDGVTHLEKAALCFLAQAGELPDSLRGLLSRVCGESCDWLEDYPWYANRDLDLPLHCPRDVIGPQCNALSADLKAKGVRFLGAWVQVLPEGHYNRLVGATHNKATVLFTQAMRLIHRITESLGPRSLRVWIDRQGGRVSYCRPLLRAFEGAELSVLEENDDRSAYRLIRPGSPLLIRFLVKGETHQMPIALASCYSKYVRELFMNAFNRYWCEQQAGLRPTGGYNNDAQRFLKDIDALIRSRNVDRSILVRAM
jgi:hypothetical protein